MDDSLSQSPWQLAVTEGAEGRLLADGEHTCCLTNKGLSQAASCGCDDTRHDVRVPQDSIGALIF